MILICLTPDKGIGTSTQQQHQKYEINNDDYISLENFFSFSQEIVILLDISGSMDLGFRLDIAKHVVFNVMSTLSEDDFITVLTFANDTRSLVDWFVDPLGDPELVQASKENIGEFTESVKQIQTQGIANFSIAFNAAFNLMEKYRANKVNNTNKNVKRLYNPAISVLGGVEPGDHANH